MWLQKNSDRSDEAKERMRQAFINERDARQARLEADRDQRREHAVFKRQLALQIDDRIKAYRDQGAGKYSEELARNDFKMALEQLGEKVAPLSAAASKANTLVQAKIQRALRLAQGGAGTGSDAKLVEQFENLKSQLYPARARGDERQIDTIMRRIEAVGVKLQAKGYEVGYGKNPYVKARGAATTQPQAAASAQDGDVLGVGLK